MPVPEAPPRPPEQDELEALIEEARRRARRRRFGYLLLALGAAMAGGGLFLVLGGGGNGGEPRGLPANTLGARPAPGSSPGPAETSYRCPTSPAALKSRPGSGIPGCNIRFWATLPGGWHEGPVRVTAFPPGAIISDIALGIRYANTPLTGPGPKWPIRLPPNGLSILIESEAPAAGAKAVDGGAEPLEPSDFRRVPVQHNEPLAHTRLYTGGWRFEVQVRVGSNGPQTESIDQANALLNSIKTTQHLCPCGRR
jgi:hypothetical protein